MRFSILLLLLCQFSAVAAGITGTVSNAATGEGMPNIEVSLVGTSLSVRTDSNGNYAFLYIDEGSYEVQATASGFNTDNRHVHITDLDGAFNTSLVLLSNEYSEGKITIVLTWNRASRDLDSYLLMPTNSGYKTLSYQYMGDNDANLDSFPYAGLDVDSQHYGNETVSIKKVNNSVYYPGLYRFYVKDHSGDGFDFTNTKVTVFNSGIKYKTFSIPNGTGRYWHVFDILGSEFVEKNIIVDKIQQPKRSEYKYDSSTNTCRNSSGTKGYNKYNGNNIPSTTNLSCYDFTSKKVRARPNTKYKYNGSIFRNSTIESNLTGSFDNVTFKNTNFNGHGIYGKLHNTTFDGSNLKGSEVYILDSGSNVVFKNNVMDNIDISSNNVACLTNWYFQNSSINNSTFSKLDFCSSQFTNIKSNHVTFKNVNISDSVFNNTNFQYLRSEFLSIISSSLYSFQAEGAINKNLTLNSVTSSTVLNLKNSKNTNLLIKNINNISLNLENAHINGNSIFSSIKFSNSNFENSTLGTKFSYVTVVNSSFKTVQPRNGASPLRMENTTCRGCDFTRADLDDARFTNVTFDNLTMDSTSLNEVVINSSDIRNTIFKNNSFKKTSIHSTYLGNVSIIDTYETEEISLSGSTIKDSNLEGFEFGPYDFNGVSFLKTNLKDSRFNEKATYSNNDFTGSLLEEAKLNNCSFNGAKFNNIKKFGGYDGIKKFSCLSCEFKKTNITTNLVDTDINTAIFEDSTLAGNSISGNLSKVIFKNINLKTGNWKTNFDDVTWVDSSLDEIYSFEGTISNSLFDHSTFDSTNFKVKVTNTSFNSTVFNSVHFFKSSFKDVDFRDSTIKYSKLIDSEFEGSKLAGADLDGTTFSTANFINVSFKEGNKDLINFTNGHQDLVTTMEGINYNGKAFQDIKFNRSTFNYVDFSGADLSKSQFNSSKIDFSYFENVDLTSAHFSNTVISETSFRAADFSGAYLHNFEFLYSDLSETIGWNLTTITDFYAQTGTSGTALYNKFTGSDLSETDFAGTTFFNTDFSGTLLSYTIFDEAKLNKSSFSSARFERTTFYDADTYQVDFSNSNLEETDGLNVEGLISK